MKLKPLFVLIKVNNWCAPPFISVCGWYYSWSEDNVNFITLSQSQTIPTGVSYQGTDRRLSNVKQYVGTITISPAKTKDKLQITYSYIFCIFIVRISALLGQIGILTVALDNSQAVSRNHVTNAVFWTAAPTVTPQGNTRRGLGKVVKFLFK